MSLMHNLIQSIVKKGHQTYDPNKPINYIERRLNEEKRFKSLPKDLKITQISNDIINGELIEKIGNNKNNIILYIHGGGFVGGSAKARRDLTFYLARHSGHNVIAINYPLAPENRFPTPVKSCFKSYCYLVKEYGAKHIAIVGESAGGNLVLATLLMAKNNKIDLPSSVSLFSPATILGKKLASYSKNSKTDVMIDENIYLEILNNYLNSENDTNNQYASPLFGDFFNFPDTLLFASDSEVLLDDSLLLKEKMEKQGVNLTFVLAHKMMHAYLTMPFYKEAIIGLKQTINFIKIHF